MNTPKGAVQQKSNRNFEEEIKYEQEVVISTLVNEVDLSLKAYEIVNLMRNLQDNSGHSYNNEFFDLSINPLDGIRATVNPRQRLKTLSWMTKDVKQDNLKMIRALKYASDHRDEIQSKRIPKGYKIIGVKGFRKTYESTVIHVCDFIIWKPPPFWLDISPEGQKAKE